MGDLVGKTLGKYEIVALRGHGGMGDVYKAYQPGLDRYVAIKTLHGHLANKQGFVRRFEREGAALARLRHPNIVQIHDYDSQDDLHYLVMEFIDGLDLRAALMERIDQGKLFAPVEAARVLGAVADAIDYAHAHGMIHRDIKPANIMFTAEGQVVLTDFGIARILGASSSTVSGAIGGTPDYMSPEQCRGEQADARSDIYGLGATLYELLTGRVPFVADSPMGVVIKHVTEDPPPPSQVNPDLPVPVGQVLLKALSKEPDDRYQTARDMANALRHSLDLPIGAEPAPLPIPARPPQGTILLEPRPEAPFQAPPDSPQFVGREEELSDLYVALTSEAGQRSFCLVGMGGIGKTVLAVHVAHTLRDSFPDGVLWANAATSEPLAILDSWAHAFDCDFSGLPDLETRAAAMRGVLTDKKVLVVLDDVRSAETVRPLLPGGLDNAALLTTRDMELAVSLAVGIYPLSALPTESCHRLMAYILGEERLEAEAACADEICGLLGNLPLAVEIAAQRLASRRRWQLADMAERLRDEHSRLRELRIHDREVRASFALSWDALDSDLRRSFSLLAVFEGRPFTAAALAVVGEMGGREASDHMEALEALSLVSEEGRVHYRQHPLLADFAREQLGDDQRAYAMMAWYYLAYATEYQKDYPALEEEWGNLLAGMRIAREHGMRQVVIDYAEALTDAWFARGRYTDARQGYAWASKAAQALGDHRTFAVILRRWGQACTEQADYGEAEQRLSESLQVSESLANQRGIADAQFDLGVIATNLADYDRAQQLLTQSQRLREQLDDPSGAAEALWGQARVHRNLGEYERARQLGEQALSMQQAEQDKLGTLRTLRLLAHIVGEGMGDHNLAWRHCSRALDLCRELQESGELAITMYEMSEICSMQGDYQSAREYAQDSLALLKRIGDRRSQAQVLHQLSLVETDLKDYGSALEAVEQSLNLCQELKDEWGEVYVLRHLGRILSHLDRTEQAREVWSRALGLARNLQHPMTEALEELTGL